MFDIRTHHNFRNVVLKHLEAGADATAAGPSGWMTIASFILEYTLKTCLYGKIRFDLAICLF